ncbi:carbohydrate ABC transporter substrate-binding protein, CUT1 family [Streptomyces zhaozhouensis]|uniref:Carbohydrate ABC transporter substrate-binding protein, CUT1 family n=1 Tax=Streptomyces zhaozhouensis TaxID=1300267 RepID=A0A286DW54_9ACTN|nr:extracellular solute-binding protein [Streptomyces zhaozhouensis]SOD62863.1 carbohydrate ABC transporter substrate-binding protein, CUT1 family [Streptomyces zhaozhouensis]
MAPARQRPAGPSRRRVLTLGLAATAGAALAGCGSGGGSAGGKTVLEFPSWQAAEGSFALWWRELIAAFEEAHPDVEVDFYSIPYDSYVDQLTIRFAAGDRPEITHLPARNAAEFAGRGWLTSLADRLRGTDIPRTWTPLQEEMRLNGEDHGVLLLGYGYTLYYNERLLESVGAGVPTTPEELISAAEAITGDGVYGFGATTTPNPDNYTELAAFVVGNGGTLSTDDGGFTADSDAAIAGLDLYRRALAQAPRGIQGQQRNELFLTGKIAMLLDGPFLLNELSGASEAHRPHLKVARAPFPHVPGGVSNSIHMPAGIEGRKADAVWDLIALASSPEWQRRYTEVTLNPAPREDSATARALEETPELALFQRLADEAVSIFPGHQTHRERFGRVSDLVSAAATSLITTDEPTASIAAHLQDELEAAMES